jgi:hypothetical protein
MTIGEALDAFEVEWVDPLAFTPQTSYRRTLRLLRLELGTRVDDPLESLAPDDLRRRRGPARRPSTSRASASFSASTTARPTSRSPATSCAP